MTAAITTWVQNVPCLFVYDCLSVNGFIPKGIKTLIITSSYDAVVFYFEKSKLKR